MLLFLFLFFVLICFVFLMTEHMFELMKDRRDDVQWFGIL